MPAMMPLLIASAAAFMLLLGLLHLLYTFSGKKLLPRDATLQTQMTQVSPHITRETTMWKAWIGFNASHSYGAILFGLVYGYLALLHSAFLFEATFLLVLGQITLMGYTVLGKRYWFSVPYRSIVLATLLYAGGLLSLVWSV